MIEARCNVCNEVSYHRTRSEAAVVLAAHEALGHLDLMWTGPNGRTRYRPLTWPNPMRTRGEDNAEDRAGDDDR
jgi:hypothetical protein